MPAHGWGPRWLPGVGSGAKPRAVIAYALYAFAAIGLLVTLSTLYWTGVVFYLALGALCLAAFWCADRWWDPQDPRRVAAKATRMAARQRAQDQRRAERAHHAETARIEESKRRAEREAERLEVQA